MQLAGWRATAGARDDPTKAFTNASQAASGPGQCAVGMNARGVAWRTGEVDLLDPVSIGGEGPQRVLLLLRGGGGRGQAGGSESEGTRFAYGASCRAYPGRADAQQWRSWQADLARTDCHGAGETEPSEACACAWWALPYPAHQVGEAKLGSRGRRLPGAPVVQSSWCTRACHVPGAGAQLRARRGRLLLLLVLARQRRGGLLQSRAGCARRTLAATAQRAAHASTPRPVAARRGGRGLLGGRAGGRRRAPGAAAQVGGVLLAYRKAEALHAQPVGAPLQGKRRVPACSGDMPLAGRSVP